MEKIPLWWNLDVARFAGSDAAQKMVRGWIDFLTNPMNAIEEAAGKKKKEIDWALHKLRSLPVTRILEYLERHTELKQLLSLE